MSPETPGEPQALPETAPVAEGASIPAAWPLLEEFFDCPAARPEWMDVLWSLGWRHFARQFFRYSVSVHEGQVVQVIPLRIDLDAWIPSKSQARILRLNSDLEVTLQKPQLDLEHRTLFQGHTGRFRSNVPQSLEDFMGPHPGETDAGYPCECQEICVRRSGVLVAASYLDLGVQAASSVYGFFSLEEHRRSLGIATLLWEIEYARQRGCRFLYPGYAFVQPSPYDYKKRLGFLQAYDWQDWKAFP